MKAAFENVATLQGNSSFVAYSFTVPFFEFKWHYHPEYELTLITKGSGKRIIGDSHENFTAGDLVLSGSGLPHTWSSEPFGNKSVSAVVIQFSEDFVQHFTQFSECREIHELLSQSQRGLFFNSGNLSEISKSIIELPQKNGLSRITSLLEILQQLSEKESVALSSDFYTPSRSKATESRINEICQFLQDHSSENITISEASEMLHLSKSAFCKFFRRAMKASFSDYLNEIRIAKACHQLTETDKTIREIAMETGFESLTYFNRVFLKKKNRTPTAFRKNISHA
ncbi:AraC family transcriptional regulator [Flavobacterium sp. 3HN19-14]|uniref:AraC family transcriptional regulator n=1 Tax=Flavobacterium sp. 3HN19-14 TaxID=3448133 RepID=UPI003EE04E16